MWGEFKHNTHFTVVRNPYSRLYSCYKNKIAPDRRNTRRMQNGVNQNCLGGIPGLYGGMPFSEFAEIITEVLPRSADVHFAPQYLQLPGHGKRVDKVFKMENMAELKNWLRNKGVPNPDGIGHRNKTEGNYKDEYTPQLYKLVGEYYATDFKTFDYERH